MKLKIFLTFIAQLFTFADGIYPPVLKVGYVLFSPYVYREDSKLKGSITDYFNKIFYDNQIQWIEIPLPRVSRSLEDRTIDIFATYFKTPQRLNEVGYPSKPYTTLTPTLCTLKASLEGPLESIINKTYYRVAVVRGLRINETIAKNPNLKLVEVTADGYVEKSQKLLEQERVDFTYFGGHSNVQNLFSTKNPKVHCMEIKNDIQEVFMVTTKDSPLLKKIEERIIKLGTLKN